MSYNFYTSSNGFRSAGDFVDFSVGAYLQYNMLAAYIIIGRIEK